MTELKTLNDLEGIHEEWMGLDCMVSIKKLRAEAIKWVKEDYSIIEMIRDGLVVSADYFTKRWMKRLDITEEDLK